MTKINAKDWCNLPTERWNTLTFTTFLIDETRRIYDAEYKPGGRGSLSQRWNAERGMIKREIDKKGPEVLRKFIEICMRNYKPSGNYTYATFGFMCGYLDRYWNEAEQAVKQDQIVEQAQQVDISSADEGWF